MGSKIQITITVYLALFTIDAISQTIYDLVITDMELKATEPIQLGDPTAKSLVLERVSGTIGASTVSSLTEVEVLVIRFSHIDHIDDAALCTIPNLRELSIFRNTRFPVLNRWILSGCSGLKKFETTTPIRQTSLNDMMNLQELRIYQGKAHDFSRQHISHLEELKILSLSFDMFNQTDEGLFCPSAKLEILHLSFSEPSVLSQSLFEGCSGLKEIYISGSYRVTVPDNQNIFSNLSHLEKLQTVGLSTGRLKKDFFSDLPNLKTLILSEGHIWQLDRDAFEGAPNLKYLSIVAVKLKESDLEALRGLQSLEQLTLFRNNLENIDTIRDLPNLKSLTFVWNSMSKFEIVEVKRNLPSLEELNLIGNPLDPQLEKDLLSDETWTVILEPKPELNETDKNLQDDQKKDSVIN